MIAEKEFNGLFEMLQESNASLHRRFDVPYSPSAYARLINEEVYELIEAVHVWFWTSDDEDFPKDVYSEFCDTLVVFGGLMNTMKRYNIHHDDYLREAVEEVINKNADKTPDTHEFDGRKIRRKVTE